jgi:hypothetical protein
VRGGAGFQGWLQARAGNSFSERRHVQGATCREAVDALAVVAAIALRSPAPADPAASPLPTDVIAAPVPSDSTTPSARDAFAVTEPAAVVAVAPAAKVEGAYAVTLDGGLELGLVPGQAVPVLELSLARGTFIGTPTEGGRGRPVGPWLRLGAALLGNVSHRALGETTDVGGQRLTVGACLAPGPELRGLVILTCADLSAGMIGTRFTNATGGKSPVRTSGFGALGLAIDVRYDLTRWFHLGLRLGGGALTDAITARRDDGSEIFRSSRFTGHASFGLGAHF